MDVVFYIIGLVLRGTRDGGPTPKRKAGDGNSRAIRSRST